MLEPSTKDTILAIIIIAIIIFSAISVYLEISTSRARDSAICMTVCKDKNKTFTGNISHENIFTCECV
jgi:hypothetical protein